MDKLHAKLAELGFYHVFGDHESPPTEARVRQLESKIGQRLPEEYRSFLLEFGSIGPNGELVERLHLQSASLRRLHVRE